MEKKSQVKEESITKLSLFPDGIYINQKNNLVSISQYKLLEDNITYQGGLKIFDLSKSGLSELQTHSFEGDFGIFDMKWISEDKIITANENNKLSIFDCNGSLKISSEIELSSKCIYVDYEKEMNNSFIALSNGGISQVDLQSEKEIFQEQVHSDYVWMVKKQPKSNLLFSGADDFHLSIFDFKSQESFLKYE
jgi:WD40 repeat protein